MVRSELVPKYELYRSGDEQMIRDEFFKHFRKNPIPDNELLSNIGLFLNSKNLARLLYIHYIYTQIVDVQGIIVEFGTRWGQNMALFSALRGIYEPFNRHRKIVGFDTFTGFPSISEKDAKGHEIIKEGGFAVSADYEAYLEQLLELQERDNPISHIKKFEIRAGDAILEIDKYLVEYPETIIALAYFDLDIYEPTKACLKAIKPHLVKGSLLAFDELNDHDSPGETIALREIMPLNSIRLRRYPFASRVSFFEVE